MKKNISKKLALSMSVGMGALSMVSGVAPVFAADAVAGVSGEQADIEGLLATITATGISESGVTVKAYQLVDGYYEEPVAGTHSLVRYVLTDPVNGKIADFEKPTAAEMATIANNIGAGKFTGEEIAMTKGQDGNYTASVEPGLYMILVSGATDTVFNPSLVAVNVTDANAVAAAKITAGSVDLTKAFNTGTAAYIKSSKSDMNKTVSSAGGADTKSGKGDTVKVGETISFKLDSMTIPSFSGDYTKPVYKISDTLESGKFEAISNLVVKVNGQALTAADDTYKLTYGTGNTSFVIEFAEAYLRAHAADATRPTVEVTYDTKLTTAAGVNYAENYNHAKLEYSNNPNDETSMKEIVKNTYNYTFAIDGLLDGEVNEEKNNEFNKVTQAGGTYTNKKSQYALAGAEFTLYSDEGLKTVIAKSTTDADGHMLFTGLDEGTYYIKETKAPATYALNDNLYKVVISATLDEDTGIMKEYSVVTQVKVVNTTNWVNAGSVTYTNTKNVVAADGGVTNTITTKQDAVTEVVNTKIQSLPSTGGAGTIMAFAVSAGLAATTGGIVVTAKKKENK